MIPNPILSSYNRLGIHYFPDALHYREQDLEIWLPELTLLGVGWLTLLAPAKRAIPEVFVKSLLSAGIQPVLHFSWPVGNGLHREEARGLFETYAHWGVRYVALYDRPNSRVAWAPSAWAQTDLVDRFLDLFIPLAQDALQEGLTPLFPPLEPGGDYWDLAFLRAALASLQRRGGARLVDGMALGAYAWAGNRPLDWGAGGVNRWPGARPYLTPPGVQDHQGFKIYEWYLDIAREELGKPMPVILLRAGSCLGDHSDSSLPSVDIQAHTHRNFALAKLATGAANGEGESLPEQVLACNFWLLAADAKNRYAAQVWFRPSGRNLPIVDALRQLAAVPPANAGAPVDLEKPVLIPESEPVQAPTEDQPVEPGEQAGKHSISHYVLLPLYGWGVAEWDLNLIQPILEKSHPTIGFSLVEARLAERVTVVGEENIFSTAALESLRTAGCRVERILPDGTLVAT